MASPPQPPARITFEPHGEFGPHLIFFDLDSADLNDRGRSIVDAFVQGIASIRYSRIAINGNADRSGSTDHNDRLSARRADSVAAELVRLGVDRRIIDISASGETRPLVPTRDGVQEAQNRVVFLVTR